MGLCQLIMQFVSLCYPHHSHASIPPVYKKLLRIYYIFVLYQWVVLDIQRSSVLEIIDTAGLCCMLKKMQTYMAPLGFNPILSMYNRKDR